MNLISESGVTVGSRASLYEGPTSTIEAKTTSSMTMSAGASVTTTTAEATATETGKEGGAVGGRRVDGVVAGVVGLVGLVLGAVG